MWNVVKHLEFDCIKRISDGGAAGCGALGMKVSRETEGDVLAESFGDVAAGLSSPLVPHGVCCVLDESCEYICRTSSPSFSLLFDPQLMQKL